MLTNIDKNNIKYINKAVSLIGSNDSEHIRKLNATKFAMIDITYKIHEEIYKPKKSAKSLDDKIAILESTDFCSEIINPAIQYFKNAKKRNFTENNSDLIKAIRLYEFCLPDYNNVFCLYFSKYRFPKYMEGIVYTFLNSIGEFCVLKTAMLARNMLCYYLNYLLQGEIEFEGADNTQRTLGESEQITLLQKCKAPEALIYICDEIRYIANDLLHRTQNEILGHGRKRYIRLVIMGIALICVMPLNRDDECISNINNLIGVDQDDNYVMKNISELIELTMRLDDVICDYKSDVDTKSLMVEASEIIGRALVLGKRTPNIPEWDNSIVPATAAAVRYMIEEICFSSILQNQSREYVREWLMDPDSDSTSVTLINNAGLTYINQTVFHLLRINFININAHKKMDMTEVMDWEFLHETLPLIEYAFTRGNSPTVNFFNENSVSLITNAELAYVKLLSNRYVALETSLFKYDVQEYKRSVNQNIKSKDYVPGKTFGIIYICLQIVALFILVVGIVYFLTTQVSSAPIFVPMIFAGMLLLAFGCTAYLTYVWLIKE